MNNASQNRSRMASRAVPEPGLTDSETGASLRRQFIGSVAAAMIVTAMTGFAAMRPAHQNSAEISYRSATVQQPTFVSPSDRVIALKQH